MRGLCTAAGFGGAGILLLLLAHVVVNGISALSPQLVTELPTPLGVPGGGLAHAVVGSAIIVGLACLWGIPLGIGAGIYLAEYAGPGVGTVVRFMADVLSGVPSIVLGIFGYTIIVTQMGGFSGLAGAFALGVITLPIIARTTEEVLRLVPGELREASLALGVPRWRTILRIVVPTASTGMITGTMLAVARIAGETAPLIFTTLGNNFWSSDPTRPMAAMTLTIFQYAIWPYEYLHQQAWAASLLLMTVVLLINVIVRLASRSYGPR
ncbi:MAG: phosphate ABC transporter permease PstA [Chloroflexi bacterium]|nr:phosphate ABC transporter permease PstA [Chloroflexota bacterium]